MTGSFCSTTRTSQFFSCPTWKALWSDEVWFRHMARGPLFESKTNSRTVGISQMKKAVMPLTGPHIPLTWRSNWTPMVLHVSVHQAGTHTGKCPRTHDPSIQIWQEVPQEYTCPRKIQCNIYSYTMYICMIFNLNNSFIKIQCVIQVRSFLLATHWATGTCVMEVKTAATWNTSVITHTNTQESHSRSILLMFLSADHGRDVSLCFCAVF